MLVTPFGRIERITTGYQRLEYLGWSTEIGLPISQKFELYYGMDLDLRIGKSENVEVDVHTVANTGEESHTRGFTNDNFVESDVIDLNISAAIEYKIINNLKLNFSVRRDFGGVNGRSGDGSGQLVKTTVFQFKFIVPFYLSDHLAHRAFLISHKK